MSVLRTITAIPELESSLFDWLTWRSGYPFEAFHIHAQHLVEWPIQVRESAIGWCPAEQVPCRPAGGLVALMCDVGNGPFWFHIKDSEFMKIFGDGR